jgi:hypothetical protein
MSNAFARGQAPDQWQIETLLAWARENPKGGCAGSRPLVCACTDCGGPAVILPGRVDAKTADETRGHCICRRCSFNPADPVPQLPERSDDVAPSTIFACSNGHFHKTQALADRCRSCKAADRRRRASAEQRSYRKGVRDQSRRGAA